MTSPLEDVDASAAAASDTSHLQRADACGWCSGPIAPTARRDSVYCSTRCRQAAHRAKVERSVLERTDRPLRLAYADPPYVGMARRCYGSHPDYAGEVDHRELVSRLAGYDGWALSCSGRSVPAIAALCVAEDLDVRLAVWVRRPRPRPGARGALAAWEGVLYVPARRLVDPSRRLLDVLTDAPSARPRTTLPTAVVGMKPPAFAAWLFDLLGARPGDELEDLYPGSGIIGRCWRQWSGDR